MGLVESRQQVTGRRPQEEDDERPIGMEHERVGEPGQDDRGGEAGADQARMKALQNDGLTEAGTGPPAQSDKGTRLQEQHG
uniref:Uncharacterized protein n=1 Tax=Knipowitschia caucasica TaxID=637954 RepID=A0AAV2JI07_KNICA